MRRSTIAASAGALCSLLALAACSSANTSNVADSGSAKGKTVCYITAADSHVYATPANNAFYSALSAAGVKVISFSEDFSVQQGTNDLSTCISRKPNAIVLWPLDPEAYTTGLARAQQAKIPVDLINSPVGPDALKYVTSFTGPDNSGEGKIVADFMNKTLGGKGNVVILAGQAGNGTTIDRTNGFLNELKAQGSEIKILATEYVNFDEQTSLTTSRDLLSRFGSQINGVYGDDASAQGFIDAYKQAGLPVSKVPVITGINGQQNAFKDIESGYMAATVLQAPSSDGKLAAVTIIKVLEGEKVPSRIALTTPLITKDNISQYKPAF